MKGIYAITQEVLSDIAKDENMAVNPNKDNYTSFLTNLSKKLELVTGSEIGKAGRTHSSSEDNICLSNKYILCLTEVNIQASGTSFRLLKDEKR